MAGYALKRPIAFLSVLAAVFLSMLLSLKFRDQKILKIGIFFGSNWEVPGTMHYDIFDQAIEKYERQYGDIKIEYEEGILSRDYSEWISGEILKGTEPDVYIVMDEDFNTLVSAGALRNLDKMISRDDGFDRKNIYNSAYQSGSFAGSQYAIPFECNPSLMFVNKTLLKKEGIPMPGADWTWEDLYDICRKAVKDTDGDGQMDQFGCYGYTWLEAVYANGVQPFNEDGTESCFTDERFTEAIDFVRRLMEVNHNYQVTANDFDLGRVIFRPLTFSDYRTYMPYPWRIKKYSDFEWNCIPMPAGPSGTNIASMDTLMVGISARTTKARQAWNFVKLLTMDEGIQRFIYEDASGASILKSVTRGEETMDLLNRDTPGGSDIDLSLLDQAIETAVIPAKFRQDREAYERTDNFLSALVLSDEDIYTSMFQLKKEIDRILRP